MQIVIDIPEEVLRTRYYTDYFGCGSHKLTETLDNATPYRHKGHWIKVGGMSYVNDKYQCSECGEIITEMPVCMTEPLYKCCPYCMAEMESSDADSN